MRCALVAGTMIVSCAAGVAAGRGIDLRGEVSAGGRPAAHAVVWLVGTEPARPPEKRRVVLDQRNLSFDPRVLVVQVGTTVEMPNNDRVLHNVFSFRDGKRFDLGLYPVGTLRRVTFDHAGLSRVFCNIHPNMAAYVMAVDTPYFTIADEDGRLVLPAVARGQYTWHAWRPGASEITGPITVDEGASVDARWP